MRIAIVGAGELGGAIAHALARRNRVREILLVDSAGGVAAGKALDIQQAGPIDGFSARVRGATDVAVAIGSAALVLADQAGAPGDEWRGEAGLALIKRIHELDRGAVIVCAGAAARDVIETALAEAGMGRERLFGSAPGALVSAVRAIVALHLRRSPADVSLSVIGAPPGHLVVPWSEASVGGYSIARLLGPAELARIDSRLPSLWPPGPYALASAAARAAEAVAIGSRRVLHAFVGLDGEGGPRGRVAAMPVTIGPRGVDTIVAPTLSVHERVLFENALRT